VVHRDQVPWAIPRHRIDRDFVYRRQNIDLQAVGQADHIGDDPIYDLAFFGFDFDKGRAHFAVPFRFDKN